MKPSLPTPPSDRRALARATAAPAQLPEAAVAVATVPLWVMAVLLGLAGVLVAAAVAFLLAPPLGPLGSPWAAALAAAAGVAAAAVPVGALMMRLAREKNLSVPDVTLPGDPESWRKYYQLAPAKK